MVFIHTCFCWIKGSALGKKIVLSTERCTYRERSCLCVKDTLRMMQIALPILTIFISLVACQLASANQFESIKSDTDSAATLTSSFRGLNWADTRDNFQDGVIYLSGLSSTDNYSSASIVADRIVGQMYALTGGNTVRMPINEPTVSKYWNTYTGAIDAALTKGKVILCYWAVKQGRPADLAAFKKMWTTVVEKYGTNENAYFEPINEPYGYKPGELNDFYHNWLIEFPNIPRRRIILDGSGYAQKPITVGADPRLSGCLLGYHVYAFFSSINSETTWQRQMQNSIGIYYPRTVCTEFGAVMNIDFRSGKTQYDHLLNYTMSSSDKFVTYIRAITSQFRAWCIGSVYWPGVRDNDFYSLCTKTGSGSGITLSINNDSGLSRIQFGWGKDNEYPKN